MIGSEDEPPTREDIEAVVRYLPALREQFAVREGDPAFEEGVYSLAFTTAVRQIVRCLFEHKFMFPFNYQPWAENARRLTEDDELLRQSDLGTIRKLLVVHWRQDYWDDENSHWEFIAANDYKIVNMQYGLLAKRLLKNMARPAPLWHGKDPVWILSLGEMVNRSHFGLEMHLVMRSEVAKALEELEMV